MAPKPLIVSQHYIMTKCLFSAIAYFPSAQYSRMYCSSSLQTDVLYPYSVSTSSLKLLFYLSLSPWGEG